MKIFLIITAGFIFLFAFASFAFCAQANCVDSAFNADSRKFVWQNAYPPDGSLHGTDRLTPWPSVPIPEWRLWDAKVTWPDLEPGKGQRHFDDLDKSLALAEAHHANVLMTLGLTPRWASARPQEASGYSPGYAAEPKDIEDWRSLVRTVATRYKGRIHAYEIWNEPNVKRFWTGT